MKRYIALSLLLHCLVVVILGIKINNSLFPKLGKEPETVSESTTEVSIIDKEDGPGVKKDKNDCPDSFGGIGISIINNIIKVVYKGYPAYKAGLKEGDIISHVDGDGEIRGPAGTVVTIEIIRNTDRLFFTLTRENICVKL